MAHITFENITIANEHIALDLHVAQGQTSFIEDVPTCLFDAKENPIWHPILLLVDGIAVGFAMYGLWLTEGKNGRVWLDRYMIDERFQGKGYGKQILSILCRHIKNSFGYTRMYTNVYAHNTVALKLYEKAGFRINGEYDVNGELVLQYDMQ